jgi:protein tyrosine phosphatase (PTP) superfamily phosphohydrolase (DUF442 family)
MRPRLSWDSGTSPDPDIESCLASLPAVYRLTRETLTSGQPTEGHFTFLRDAGCECVLSLLPPGQEPVWEEGLCDDLGLDYHVVPVVWLDPRPRDFERFRNQMTEWSGRRMLVHCAANLRVSSFFYVWRTLDQLCDPDTASTDLHAVWTPNPVWANFIESMTGTPLKPPPDSA